MRRVYKYPLAVGDLVTLRLPVGAKVLSVQEQHGEMALWALVDPEAATEPRVFVVYGTGHGIVEADLTYVATVQTMGGRLVWHVFEEGAKR